MSDMEPGAQDLRNRLDREEFARSETMSRLRQAETAALHERDVPLSALHGELGELRQRLRQQEEFQARSQQAWRQEIEMARRQAHLTSQHMPLSSKTSDAEWEYVHSQVGSQKGLSFPVGSEVRSPELGSPTLRSPTSRSKVTSETQPGLQPVVQDVNLDHQGGPSFPSSADSAQDSSHFRTYLASGGYGAGHANAASTGRANAFRDAQLQERNVYCSQVTFVSSHRNQDGHRKDRGDKIVKVNVKDRQRPLRQRQQGERVGFLNAQGKVESADDD